MAEDKDHTFSTRFRIPKVIWDAYAGITDRLDTDRSARLLDHIRADFKEHGTAQELAALEAGEQELTERRARKGGRPKKSPAEEALNKGATAAVQADTPGLAKMVEGFKRPASGEEKSA